MKHLHLLLTLAAFTLLAACGHNEPNNPNENPGGDTTACGFDSYPASIIGCWKIESCILTTLNGMNETDLTSTSYHGKHIESFNEYGSHPIFEDARLINHTNYKFRQDTLIFFDDNNTFADEYIVKTLNDSQMVYIEYGENWFISYTFSRVADYSEQLVGTWTVDRLDPDTTVPDFALGTEIYFSDGGVMIVAIPGNEYQRYYYLASDDINIENTIVHISQCDEHNLVLELDQEGTTVTIRLSR